MATVKANTTIREFQAFVQEVYGLSNDRYFSTQDMSVNVERFMTRALKGIRKGNKEKTKTNLLISLSWFMSMLNQLHIDIEEEIWKRFPYLCSYCASAPCVCKAQKIETRQQVTIDERKRPQTMEGFQIMFNQIYPALQRTIEHAGVHLAEEMGEVSESILTYRGSHNDADFKKVILECADFISCMMGVFNSLDMNIARELSLMFQENCHACKKSPCICNFTDITSFKS